MWCLLITLDKNIGVAIPVVMLAGFLFGFTMDDNVVAALQGLIMPFTMLLVYPVMVTLHAPRFREAIQNMRLQVVAQVINFCIIPFLAFGLGQVFFPGLPYMALGLLLAFLLPLGGLPISRNGFARGNIGRGISVSMMCLTIGALATPFYIRMLLGGMVEIDLPHLFLRIGSVVFLPMLLGSLARMIVSKRFSETRFRNTVAPRMPALSTIGVLGMVFVAMAQKAKAIAADPTVLGIIFIPLLIMYLFNFFMGTVIGKAFFPRVDAVTLVHGTVIRNLPIALAIAMNAFGAGGSDAALVIAVSYGIQVHSASWYLKFWDVIFGPPERMTVRSSAV